MKHKNAAIIVAMMKIKIMPTLAFWMSAFIEWRVKFNAPSTSTAAV